MPKHAPAASFICSNCGRKFHGLTPCDQTPAAKRADQQTEADIKRLTARTDWTKTQNRITHAALVYQAGMANVFATCRQFSGPRGQLIEERQRLCQGDFRYCEAFASGMQAAGVDVSTMHCNQAGDITNAEWSTNLDAAPFSGRFHPVGKV